MVDEDSSDARSVIDAAERILAAELPEVPLSRPFQFIVGWTRALMDQSRTIATLTSMGLSHAAAPNRRLFAEIALRLTWLYGVPPRERVRALDSMIQSEARSRKAFHNVLNDWGVEHGMNLEEDEALLEALQLQVAESGFMDEQARKFLAAARATENGDGLYIAWREETQYSHAFGALAAAYAPIDGDQLGKGAPPEMDPPLNTHRMICLSTLMVVFGLLTDGGVSNDVAKRILTPYIEE